MKHRYDPHLDMQKSILVEALRAVAEMLLAIFERWGLDEVRQAELLGLPGIMPLQSGQPLPDTRETLERAGYLLAIDRELHRLYPDNRAMVDGWVIYRHSALDWSSPLAVMLTGLDGIRKARFLLEEPACRQQQVRKPLRPVANKWRARQDSKH